MKHASLWFAAVQTTLLALASPAAAQNQVKFTKDGYPRAVTERPITLPQWMVELRAEAMVNLSNGSVFKGVSLPPDVYIGFTDWFTFGIQHSQTLGVYNLPGSAPLCLSADDNRHCAGGRVYNQFAFDGKFNVVRKPKFELAVHAVLGAVHLDPLAMGTRGGVQMRVRAHKMVTLDFDPALGIGFNERDGILGPAGRNREFLYAPMRLTLQPTELVDVHFDVYTVLPLSHTDDQFRIGSNVGVGFALSSRIDVGADLRLPALLGGELYRYAGRRGFDAVETGAYAQFRF